MRIRDLCLYFCGLFLLSVLILPSVIANQTESLPSVTKLHAESKHDNLDQTITGLLTHYHYRQAKLDDEQSSAILDAYLQALDYNRSYFLASDIASFKKYRFSIDNYLQAGELKPAYEMFNIYQQRLAERTARLQIQLNRPFNFNIDESLRLDREDAPWATTKAELDEIWRKRLKHELLLLTLDAKSLDEAKETLLKRYEGLLRRTAQSNSEDVFQIYMNAVAKSFDPHTAYFSPRTYENFNIQMRLSLEGIGTVLRMEEDQITVVELVPGGPAALSKQLHPDDKIIGVGQGDTGPMVDVVGWRLDDVVDLIRGPRESIVRLKLIPAKAGPGVTKTIRLVRNTIKLEKQAAKSEIKTLPGEQEKMRVGIITIPTFYSDFAAAQRGDSDYRSTTRDVRRLLNELNREHIDGLVVDLRQNGGGSLQEAVELTGLFIKEGPVVQVRNAKGNIEIEADPDPTLVYEGPMAVLVNRYSASASEIFAGALQDYGRAIIIGDPTFGKGTVQTLVNLNLFMPKANGASLGQLKLTIAKFYRINGSSTQHRGVIPDILFPTLFDSSEVGESSQDFALPWDEIKPANYRRSHQLTNLIPELKRRHDIRMAKDPEYAQLLGDIAEAEHIRAQNSVSLLESKRKAEQERETMKQLERENKRRRTLGLAPLHKGDEIPEIAEEEQPDLLLDESARIVANLVTLLDNQGSRLVMSAE